MCTQNVGYDKSDSVTLKYYGNVMEDYMSRPMRKRLSVDVPDWLHKQIVASAKARNCTITRWVLRALHAKIMDEKKYGS